MAAGQLSTGDGPAPWVPDLRRCAAGSRFGDRFGAEGNVTTHATDRAMVVAGGRGAEAGGMPRRIAGWIMARLMLVILCSAVTTILGLVIVSAVEVRDERTQGLGFAAVLSSHWSWG